MTDRDNKGQDCCPGSDGGICRPGAAVAAVTPLPSGVYPNRRVRVRTWWVEPGKPLWPARPRRPWWRDLRHFVMLFLYIRRHG